MKIQIAPFEKAIDQLQTSVKYLSSPLAQKDPSLYIQFRGASIQAFEYSYELAVKMLKRQLKEIMANPQELNQLTFGDLMRRAADAGLIEDVKRFLLYRDSRNLTSHTYDENTANDVIKVVPDFLKDAIYLRARLQERNP